MSTQDGLLRAERIKNVLQIYVATTGDHDIYGLERNVQGCEFAQTVQDWTVKSLVKPSDMPKWWRAGGFEPEAVQALIMLGVNVSGAKLQVKVAGELDTYVAHVSSGRLTAKRAARKILALN